MQAPSYSGKLTTLMIGIESAHPLAHEGPVYLYDVGNPKKPCVGIFKDLETTIQLAKTARILWPYPRWHMYCDAGHYDIYFPLS